MLKVVIADDEERICRLVRALADWDALGMEIVGIASNGLEALQMVEGYKPDILITDIRMPGCDGLELIEKVRRISTSIEIIIISGYAQFEYAQTAIRYGVGGYLLKPIKKDALTATLEELGQRRRERVDSASAMEHFRRDSLKSQNLLWSRLAENLRYNKLDSPTVEQLREEYDFPLEDDCLQVFILKMDCDPEKFNSISTGIIQKKLAEIFEVELLQLCSLGFLHFERSAAYGIINFQSGSQTEIRNALRTLLNEMQAQSPFFGEVEFSLSIGCLAQSAKELPNSMREARSALYERLVEGGGRLLESAPPSSQIREWHVLDKYSRMLEHALDAQDTEALDKAVEELENNAAQISDVRGREIWELIMAAGKILTIRVSVENESELMRGFEEYCELCGSDRRLFDFLRRFQRQQLELMRERRENETIRPIRLAKQYVRQHASEPITLEDVCAATGFSTSYFSTMFKKETGEGFSKYLARVRIERAKELLQVTNLAVTEICEQVGYNDLKHFTATFKKLTGINPGQYRKLYG